MLHHHFHLHYYHSTASSSPSSSLSLSSLLFDSPLILLTSLKHSFPLQQRKPGAVTFQREIDEGGQPPGGAAVARIPIKLYHKWGGISEADFFWGNEGSFTAEYLYKTQNPDFAYIMLKLSAVSLFPSNYHWQRPVGSECLY